MRKYLLYSSIVEIIIGIKLFNTIALSSYGAFLFAIAILSIIIYIVWSIMRVDSHIIPGPGLFE